MDSASTSSASAVLGHQIKVPCAPFWWLERVSIRLAFFTGEINGGSLGGGPWISSAMVITCIAEVPSESVQIVTTLFAICSTAG